MGNISLSRYGIVLAFTFGVILIVLPLGTLAIGWMIHVYCEAVKAVWEQNKYFAAALALYLLCSVCLLIYQLVEV